MRIQKTPFVIVIVLSCALVSQSQSKPKLAFDEFFNSVEITALEISPDGNSVVIGTERADWDQQIFRTDLWFYRDVRKDDVRKNDDRKDDDGKAGSLIQLTQSGHDSEPKWSPDGRWIAFISERKTSSEKSDEADDSDSDSKAEDTSQLYLISPSGGEAIPVTQGEEDVHAFSWSANSQTIYFATRQPWTKSQKDDYKKDWKDVVQYRTAERGDAIFSLDIAAALDRHAAAPAKVESKSDKEFEDLTPGAEVIATTPLRVDSLLTSPDGNKLAFLTNAINQRQEKPEDVELYVLDLPNVARALPSAGSEPVLSLPKGQALPAPAGSATTADSTARAAADANPALTQPRRITHNTAVETRPHWANDSRHIFFTVEIGDVSGPYRDLQPHLYWVDTAKLDADSAKVDHDPTEQWAKDFVGPVEQYAVEHVAADPSVSPASTASAQRTNASMTTVLASARLGTEVQMYSATKPSDELHRITAWPGTYANISVAAHSPKIAFIYSSLGKPDEVYLADSAAQLDQAKPITGFNKVFTERDLPQGKPYRWKADDGTTIEGMLIYPPGRFEQKHLPMFTLIHGGPADADGNHFGADWYNWAALAATNGWLVFRPNYRGSVGYGDQFLQQIVPQIVSRPGKDILEGVDALVKDGIADPDHLTVGGYSYGGYMTNWLITQTTRFKAAVTGAGAVEHIGNWGNDDTTYDDAYFLGGRPWEVPQRYHDEAAIFQIDKLRTPTHMVAGADDIRVAVLEDYLLEHALYSLGIPNKLLIFPGEGHGLGKNPWHGKIKVREELKWLQKYGGVPASN
jgi:dipeptidyl aminopeptidase/acylaminoacyl peptidase